MKESWVCIITLKDDGTPTRQIPRGADLLMRLMLEKALEKLGVSDEVMLSGWGFPPDRVDDLNHAWYELGRDYDPPPPGLLERVVPEIDEFMDKFVMDLGLQEVKEE
jgi:hypothetical protein